MRRLYVFVGAGVVALSAVFEVDMVVVSLVAVAVVVVGEDTCFGCDWVVIGDWGSFFELTSIELE